MTIYDIGKHVHFDHIEGKIIWAHCGPQDASDWSLWSLPRPSFRQPRIVYGSTGVLGRLLTGVVSIWLTLTDVLA